MWLYDVSKPTKLQLVREVKEDECGDYRRLVKKARHLATTADNLKLWLNVFFESVCDIMPICENQNGGSARHLPSWFTKDMVLNKYIMDMESKQTSWVYLGFQKSVQIISVKVYGIFFNAELLIIAY
jgi:hypothetical protein